MQMPVVVSLAILHDLKSEKPHFADMVVVDEPWRV